MSNKRTTKNECIIPKKMENYVLPLYVSIFDILKEFIYFKTVKK